MAGHLLFVIGASGVGKTAAVHALSQRAVPGLACFHFDSIGVPSVEDMSRTFSSPEEWQEAATRDWVARLKAHAAQRVVLEGQTRPSFIRAALAGSPAGIILLDCHPSVRSRRLQSSRRQPELDTPQMHAWAAYLRGQADALGLPVIDTTALATDQVADQLYAFVQTVSLSEIA